LLVMFVSDWRRSREETLVREARRRIREGPEPLLGESLAAERERDRGRAATARPAPDASRSA